jgi:hypothetical protein
MTGSDCRRPAVDGQLLFGVPGVSRAVFSLLVLDGNIFVQEHCRGDEDA